jgi:type II restriction/modification system DNA methylase subunit YeeA
MNTSNLKNYAPKARRDFIEAVTKRANLFGIHNNNIAEAKVTGGLMDIEGKTFDVGLLPSRERLAKRVAAAGFDQLMELIAYTWFNRLCAIRYMELQGYLDHGLRVLSSPVTDNGFEILEHAQDVADDLGLSRERVVELKLAGDKDEELYRELLVGQCHKLHQAMPFLFEALDDETELLLPDNLTRTDSLIRALVNDVPEEDWQQVEVIGWLYQFYISEKKNAVIGRVVKSEDIPAATQLFTPNWIVQYLVQNSVGRQWMMTYSDSSLKDQMKYYIEPAEQTDAVNAQMAAITPDSIEPESIKVLDPACGSGHILVESYNVLKAIYEERGYRSRDIPKLILENNLFGLDIDDRAAQLAGFSLMMKAREDDRRIFTRDLKLNVLSLQETKHVDLPVLWKALNLSGDWNRGTSDSLFDNAQQDFSSYAADNRFRLLQTVVRLFEEAKTFGSLIEVPADLFEPLTALHESLIQLEVTGDSMQKPAAKALAPLVQQALVLAQRYSAVVANPPYMGSGGMNASLKNFAKRHYPHSKSDIFAIFMEHGFSLLNSNGFNAQVNMQSWMFLSSYERLREWLLATKTLVTMAHLGARAFGQISGEVVQTVAWVLHKHHLSSYQPVFFRLTEGGEEYKRNELAAQNHRYAKVTQSDFNKIPGSPIAYWISEKLRSCFTDSSSVSDIAAPCAGLQTSDNDRFLRLWHEVSLNKLGFGYTSRGEAENSNMKWFPCTKGGTFRRWYGNNEYVVNWENDGAELFEFAGSLYGSPTRIIKNASKYFSSGLTWSTISSSFSMRYCPSGYIFETKGSLCIPHDTDDMLPLLMLSNSKVVEVVLSIFSPTLDFHEGPFGKIPVVLNNKERLAAIGQAAINISKSDWDSYESSWDFSRHPLLSLDGDDRTLSRSYVFLRKSLSNKVVELKGIEESNNRTFIDAYGLSDDLDSGVLLKNISLISNPYYRYGNNKNEETFETMAQCDSCRELTSYAVGCMMGRYSLDREGLVYAHAGNEGFADLVSENVYSTLPADDDGIIPLTDQEWFAEDAANRFREFLRVARAGPEENREQHLQENLDFVAESLCLHALKPKRGESSLETIRRYLSTQFYKDHLKTYKKRPIYWLFSSGKQKAFECLVYLHRYNEGTLARMRTEYVTPLTGKYAVHAEQLEQQIEGADSTAESNRLKKELTALEKQLVELREFDAKLKHFADRRISLDLDDGVKVNYGKFGDLLAEVKAITGEAPEKV